MEQHNDPRDLKHLYLVDGSGFIFRAYHALPPLNRPDGTPIGAVLGFCNMLTKLLEKTDADHLAVIFDAGRKTFRNDIYAEYKVHRPPPPEDLIPQFQLIREACAAFNVPAIEMAGYEADDLIATYVAQGRQQGAKVTLVSSDKDLMQLVSPDVHMMDPMKGKIIDAEGVKEKFGVGPDRVIDVQALMGDSSDNVPGVPGIGAKTAAELINTFGDLESLLQGLDRIPQPKRRQTLIDNVEMARLSYQLVTLKSDVPVKAGLEVFGRHIPKADVLKKFLEEQNFKALITRLEQKGLLDAVEEGGDALPHDSPTNLCVTNRHRHSEERTKSASSESISIR